MFSLYAALLFPCGYEIICLYETLIAAILEDSPGSGFSSQRVYSMSFLRPEFFEGVSALQPTYPLQSPPINISFLA